jgi:hypothetical protein
MGAPAPAGQHSPPIQMSLTIRNICIRFLTAESAKANDTKKDIRFVLSPVGSNVQVQMRDGSNTPALTSETVLTRSGLVGYIRTLITLARYDQDPVRSVQFDFPAFPSVLYTLARLQNPEVLEAIEEAARITSDDWFKHQPGDGETSSDASSTTMSTDSEDDSLYADMPPLIPAECAYRAWCPCGPPA